MATRTTESAVRSLSEKTRVSQQVDAGGSPLVGEVDETHPVCEGWGDVVKQPLHQVGVGVYHHDGVRVPSLGLLLELVGDDVVHEGGLAHAGAGHVEVVTPKQVRGEVDVPWLARGGVSHWSAVADPSRRGEEHPGAGAFHQRRLVPGSRRVPEGRHLPYPQDAAAAEESGSGRMERYVGQEGAHLADLEARACRVVVVAVGGGYLAQQLLCPFETKAWG